MKRHSAVNITAVCILAGIAGIQFAEAAGVRHFATIRQTKERVGYTQILDSDTGEVAVESPSAITFTWPYVEMTSDVPGGRVFMVTFPDNSTNAELYEFNAALEIVHRWDNTSFWFFDFQYAPRQGVFYGIKVVSRYGRVVSRFTAVPGQNSVNATEIFTLPSMWYVNASTYDDEGDRFFGLINHFPNTEGFTADQQLVRCNLQPGVEDCSVVQLESSSGILHFISYSNISRTVFFAALDDTNNVATIGELDASSGKLLRRLCQVSASAIGPFVVEDAAGKASLTVKATQSSPWALWQVSLKDGSAAAVRSYAPEEYAIFSAVAKL